MSEQNRLHARLDLRVPVRIELDGRALHGHSRNLSLGGMLVDLAEPVALGSRLRLVFDLPDGQGEIDALAEVRWTDPDLGIGVQFLGLRPQAVYRLQRLMVAPAA
jgi:c-di-GMP-binding flagellar brake protein YcgR